jgi:predicted enzyme related to lactoylglutathione lyase
MWREAVSSTAVPLELIEFPADDLARGRRFWETVLDISLDERKEGEVCTLQAEYLRLTSAGWRDKLPAVKRREPVVGAGRFQHAQTPWGALTRSHAAAGS